MKLTFSDSLAIVRPFGFKDLTNDAWLSDDDIKFILAKNVKCVMISLKDVVLFSPGWLAFAIDKLRNLAKQYELNVAICDYDENMHEFIMKACAKFINFSLFENENVAKLFYSKSYFDIKYGDIALYNERIEHKDFIISKLNEIGYKFSSFSNKAEFLRQAKSAKYAISSITHLVMTQQNFRVFYKDNAVIYKINGMIDSEFIDKFDKVFHERLLACGFEYFVFWVNMSVGLNAHGANFMFKLAEFSQRYGALVCVCGVKEQNMSMELVTSLYAAGILIYQNIGDFFADDSVIYRINAEIREFEPRNITKNIIDILPQIMSEVAEIFVPFYNEQIVYAGTKISTLPMFDAQMICGCAIFFEDISMRMVVGIRRDKMQKICAFFGENFEQNSSLISSYTKIFSIIADKILYLLMSKNINAKLAQPRIFIDECFYDYKSKGAFSTLKSGKDEIGLIFLSQ